MDQPVVKTDRLTKRYGSTVGIDSLNLELGAGEIFGFIGPNGAGKTTTIRLLLDLIRPTSGSATVFGMEVRRSAMEIRSRSGYLPGNISLFDRLTSEELFDWLGRFRVGYQRSAALALAERLTLDCSRRIGELSTGNRQKVGLVQAFMHRPELLILDEPTAGLDPVVRREFRELLAEVQRDGATVLLSSHVLAEVEGICDRVGTIVDGRLTGTTAMEDLELLTSRRIKVIFDGYCSVRDLRLLPGVRNLTATVDASCSDHGGTDEHRRTIVELDASGPLDRLITEMSRYHIVDFLSRAMTLEEVFLQDLDGLTEPAGTDDPGRLEQQDPRLDPSIDPTGLEQEEMPYVR